MNNYNVYIYWQANHWYIDEGTSIEILVYVPRFNRDSDAVVLYNVDILLKNIKDDKLLNIVSLFMDIGRYQPGCSISFSYGDIIYVCPYQFTMEAKCKI